MTMMFPVILLQLIIMIGVLVLFIIFVLAHKKIAEAHSEIAKHIGTIANNMKKE